MAEWENMRENTISKLCSDENDGRLNKIKITRLPINMGYNTGT